MDSPSAIVFTAFAAPPIALAEHGLLDVCGDFVNGRCEKATCSLAQHLLYRVKGTWSNPSTRSSNVRNVLQHAQVDHCIFEEDGPGVLSEKGCRHDNDHVDIPHIQILPTIDEILSTRGSYLPCKTRATKHHFNCNVQRYVDTHFRLLRHEYTASIIDACKSAFTLVTAQRNQTIEWRQETASGAKYFLFQEVGIERVTFHERHGAIYQLSFSCPNAFRGPRKMLNAPFLQESMLCALLAVHDSTQEVNTIFLKVYMRQSTDVMRAKTGSHQRAAVQVMLADPDDTLSVSHLSCYLRSLFSATFYLLDMPHILVPSLLAHLKILQKLFTDESFAFKDYLTPENPREILAKQKTAFLPAPNWTTWSAEYNLNGLKKEKDDDKDLTMRIAPLDMTSHTDPVLQDIKDRTILDEGQAEALFESLSREIAFTQGPPGTGKTFLGVALVKSLISSRIPKLKYPPIVIVCQTNHALDDFIEELVKEGISGVSRIGGGSSAAWIEPYLLKNQRKKRLRAMKEIADAYLVKSQLHNLVNHGIAYAGALSEKGIVSWNLVETYLFETHLPIHRHFTLLDSGLTQRAVQDVRAAKMSHGFAFLYWQEGGDISDANDLINAFDSLLGESQLVQTWTTAEIAALRLEVLKGFNSGIRKVGEQEDTLNLWVLDQMSRKQLAENWLKEAGQQTICDRFAEIHRRFRAARLRRIAMLDEQDATTIAQQDIQVVGMTSTASAIMRDLLSRLAPEVMLFEEASELIEAHSLVALVPSVKHCIQIGDPLQLRPHVERKELTFGYTVDRRLDESLFERFINNGIPFSQLNTQRRAHPDLSDLLRVGDYPYLVDHPLTLTRPVVAGIASRMWWFDHNIPEDSVDRFSPLSKSSANQFEVKFVAEFVRHLVEEQNYKYREITVLTPYRGQLAALREELSLTCTVSLTETDRDALIDMEVLEDKDHQEGGMLNVSLSDMLRIATVDNYQGEQARVVIFSLVRSNEKNNIGFLADRNRTNVAISRAEDGFYVIGNAESVGKDPHWSKIIAAFRQKGTLGVNLPARCHRHPEVLYLVGEPSGFRATRCRELCKQQLPCGHMCTEPCHDVTMHLDGRLPCTKPCSRVLECGHSCKKLCRQTCKPCIAPGKPTILKCGHRKILTCGDVESDSLCRVIIKTTELACQHIRKVQCFESTDIALLICNEVCGQRLNCSHSCARPCTECQSGQTHPTCSQKCSKMLGCGHFCQDCCHEGDCPPCKQPCGKYCTHGHCHHACSLSCKPCLNVKDAGTCTHTMKKDYPLICALPNPTLPCSQPCQRALACGQHICPSLCGEQCPDVCEQCDSNQGSNEPIIILPCKHRFPVQHLDKTLHLEYLYKLGPSGNPSRIYLSKMPEENQIKCPLCSAPLAGTRRYELLSSISTLETSFDQLLTTCVQKIYHAYHEVSLGEQILFSNIDVFLENLRDGPMSVTANQYSIAERCARLIDAQQSACQTRTILLTVERNIRGLCRDLCNQAAFPVPVLHFSLRCDLLYYWSRLAMVEFAHRIAARARLMQHSDLQNRLLIKGYTAHAVEQAAGECTALEQKISECKANSLKRLEVELRIVQLCFWTVLQVHKVTEKVDVNVKASLSRIRALMRRFPQSAGLFAEGCNKLQKSIESRNVAPRFWELGSAHTSAFWQGYGKVEGGGFTQCRHHHSYSKPVFTTGCPECGPEVGDVEPTQHRNHCQENGSRLISNDIDLEDFVTKINAVAHRT